MESIDKELDYEIKSLQDQLEALKIEKKQKIFLFAMSVLPTLQKRLAELFGDKVDKVKVVSNRFDVYFEIYTKSLYHSQREEMRDKVLSDRIALSCMPDALYPMFL